jgi:hypothetical protein
MAISAHQRKSLDPVPVRHQRHAEAPGGRAVQHLLAYMLNLLHNRPRSRRAMLSSMTNWETLYTSLPRHTAIRPQDAKALENALLRQRSFMGALGMLGGFDTELWPSKIVGGRFSRPGEEPESPGHMFWWTKEIAQQYVRHAADRSCWRFQLIKGIASSFAAFETVSTLNEQYEYYNLNDRHWTIPFE